MSEQLQLINLYPECLRPKKNPLGWGHLQIYVLLLVGVITLLYLWQWDILQQHYEEQAVARLNQQELDNNLAKLKASIPAGENNGWKRNSSWLFLRPVNYHGVIRNRKF